MDWLLEISEPSFAQQPPPLSGGPHPGPDPGPDAAGRSVRVEGVRGGPRRRARSLARLRTLNLNPYPNSDVYPERRGRSTA